MTSQKNVKSEQDIDLKNSDQKNSKENSQNEFFAKGKGNRFEAVIGLEIHAQLKTQTKIFCSDSTEFDSSDNENISPISLGMPGTLPVLNVEAIHLAIRAGLALNCEIQKKSWFARKNYFYPDLPKGYQISQYEKAICEKGFVDIEVDSQVKRIGITRAHLEEDAGKSTHYSDRTLLNYNRAGVPLLEIVSEPDMRSATEAAQYARSIRQILKYIDVCDGNLEEGSLRCDCNVSVRERGDLSFGTKVEIKNVNSFRFVEKAIEYEIDRQIEAIDRGEKIIQETRLWDPDKNRTYSMRTKEDAQDYRYFPDPDLLPMRISEEQVQKIRSSMPQLPAELRAKYKKGFNLTDQDIEILISEKEIADYFEVIVKNCNNPKAAANWVMTDVLRLMKESQKAIHQIAIKPHQISQIIELVDSGKISSKLAKGLFNETVETGIDPQILAEKPEYSQISDMSEIERIIDEIIEKNPQQAAELKAGKSKLLGFFVGQAMKATQGKANPDLLNQIILKKLGV